MFNNKRLKYNTSKTKPEIDWNKFDSVLEARFYEFFRDEPNITIIEFQPKFILQEWFRYNWKAILPITYKADFLIECNGDKFAVDAKWMDTPVFAIKYKMWLKRYWHENTLIVAKSLKDLRTQIF